MEQLSDSTGPPEIRAARWAAIVPGHCFRSHPCVGGGSGKAWLPIIRQVQLGARQELNGVPILVLTAKADDELCAKLLREGAQDYLRKPFSADELQARVRNLVFMKRARQALQQELASQSENLVELALDLIAHKRELQQSLDLLR